MKNDKIIKKQYKEQQLDTLLKIYEMANASQQYEGDGIWNRFNVLMSINIVLLGVLTLIYDRNSSNIDFIECIISFFGFVMNIWGLKSMYRLWKWHGYWKEKIIQIESFFPKNMPKLFNGNNMPRKKKNSFLRTLFFSSTQPFMLTMMLMWLTIFIFLVIDNYNTYINLLNQS